MPFDKETAREAGRKGGIARAEKLRLGESAEERAKAILSNKAPKYAELLSQAALGEGEFADLPAKDRLAALMRCAEYTLGKPSAKAQPAAQPDQPESGLTFS